MKNGSDNGSGAPPRKLKFAPKIPVRKHPKPTVVITELPSSSRDDIIDKELLAKLHSSKSQDDFERKFKAEKKAVQDQVTFGYGSTSTQIRSFGPTRTAATQSEDDSGLVSLPEYAEPWDPINSHYPTSLPLRRPYSGDPEDLNRLEFGEEDSAHLPLNEAKINAAQKLGFMETGDEPKMIFLQLPSRLPLAKPPNEEKGPGKKTGKLIDLPAGLMGKLLVYRSGRVKMKLGDALFDVRPGTDQIFAEEVVAVDAKARHYCVLGELTNHAVVIPDIDSLDDLNDSDA